MDNSLEDILNFLEPDESLFEIMATRSEFSYQTNNKHLDDFVLNGKMTENHIIEINYNKTKYYFSADFSSIKDGFFIYFLAKYLADIEMDSDKYVIPPKIMHIGDPSRIDLKILLARIARIIMREEDITAERAKLIAKQSINNLILAK